MTSQVEALFSDRRSFVIGALGGVCVAAFVVAYRTQSVLLLATALLLLLITVVRLALMSAYKRGKFGEDRERAALWGRWYNIGAVVHYGAIGCFTLAVFLVTVDPLDRMLGMATLLCYMAGIPGRNFANPVGVKMQIAAAGAPLMTAMFVAGEEYSILTCVMFLPYFFGLNGLAGRLRGIFVQATVRAHDLSAMAARFDTALSNMSHGLAMFDRNGELIVYNQRLLQLLLLDPWSDHYGKPLGALLGGATEEQAKPIATLVDYGLRSIEEAVELKMRGGSVVEFTFQPMEGGGAVVLVQDVTEKKRDAARIHQLALFDELTGLVNRVQFRELLKARLETNAADVKQALLFVDLDQFKQVNDTLGHSTGDALIRHVANRLREVAPGDVIARLGGDEFVLLHQFTGNLNQLERRAQTLIQQISRPYTVNGNSLLIGASVGIAVYPTHDDDAEQLLKKADLALYRAKADGRGACRMFEPSMGVQAIVRRELEFDLRQAVKNDEFEINYQPIYDLAQGRFTVCEALVRWRHPKRGLLGPGEFIAVAEEIGLIVDIGKFVLKKACRECATWPDDVSVAVNISPVQFRRGDIVTSVAEALAESGLPASRLELELTESVLLQDVAFTSLTMRLLHMRQVTISLDDFGTGYSSLSYMNELPLSKVKIDRSFLAAIDVNQKALLMLRGLTRLSSELGLTVVVEGVETESQLRLITTATSAQLVQGYLFSRPLPAIEVGEVLRAERIAQRVGPVPAARQA